MSDEVSALVYSGEFDVIVGASDASGKGGTEGPAWNPAGYLTFTRFLVSQLIRWDMGTRHQTIIRRDTGGGNGCAIDRQGRLIMCEGDTRRVTRMDAQGIITTIAETWQGMPLNMPSDVVCRSDGSIFFTDPQGGHDLTKRVLGFAGLYRIEPDGQIAVVSNECEHPNGLAFSPDESLLYVAITRQNDLCREEGEKCTHRRVRVFDVAPDGSLTNNRIFAELNAPALGGPDGLKVDADGRVYCASAGGIWVFNPDGEYLGLIKTPQNPRNLVFGGLDLQTLFICAGESVLSLRMYIKGVALTQDTSRPHGR